MNSIPVIGKSEMSNVALVKNHLDEKGVLLIPNYFDELILSKLIGEFELALNHAENDFIIPFPYSDGKGCKVFREKIDLNVLPETFNQFSSPLMNEISNAYLKEKIILNHDIYFVKDVIGSKHHANDLHFDVSRAFKFFIYLNDTTARNGAFACVPGSQKKTAEIRKKYGTEINYENRNLTRELPFTEKDAIAIEAKAGSLIIFDTDVFHRAGNVSEGERWVMRGHTRLMKDMDEPRQKKMVTPNFLSKIKSLFNGK